MAARELRKHVAVLEREIAELEYIMTRRQDCISD